MYPCRICKAEFPRKSGRESHEARRHGAFRLQCTICSARYRHRDDLRAHVKRRHGGQGEAPATSVQRRLYSEDVDLSPTCSSVAEILRPSEPSEADVAEVGMCAELVEDVAEMAREELKVEACEEPVEDVAEIAREEELEVEACEQPVEGVAERASGEEQLEVETLTVTEAPMEEMAADGRPDLPDAPTGAEEFQRYLVEEEESFTECFESGAIKSCRKTIGRYKLI